MPPFYAKIKLIRGKEILMPKTIEAVYEDGVFKPKRKLQIPEHSRLRLAIVDDTWRDELRALLKKVHGRTKKFSPAEIERDITSASKKGC